METNRPVQVYPGGDTRCIFSDSTPYSFEVIPGNSDDLLFFFQGGGACWDKETTTGKMRACYTDANPMQSRAGVFNRTLLSNPFRDYTIVHVLYCSGDMHAGATTRSYLDSNGSPVVQAGAANTRAVLEWVKAQPEFGPVGGVGKGEGGTGNRNLVVMGASAGAIAAQLWADILLKEIPHAHASVVIDSFIGVYPSVKVIGGLIKDFGCRCLFCFILFYFILL